MPASDPIDSATVVVLRAREDGCEVLLVERHADSRAFGGAHVFPGGRVDAADAAPILINATSPPAGAPPHATARDSIAPAFRIAVIRELFEEAGLLLARIDGVPLAFDDAKVRARFHDHRAALLAGRLTFADLVAGERLDLAADHLHYFSRWITPVTAPRRYDARFFVTVVPPGQEPLHDDRETIATVWTTPAAALAQARGGGMVLAPPTVRTLEDLERLGGVPRILAYARSHRVTPILPKTVEVDGRMAILYPGDAEYDGALPGERVHDRGEGPRNRVVMGDGGWESIRTPE